jgi:hypothetical protein
MTVRALLIGGSPRRRWLVGIGMRYRAHLGNEQRQRNERGDAKLQVMGPVEQRRPFGELLRMLAPSAQSGNSVVFPTHSKPDRRPVLSRERSMNLDRDVRESFELLKQCMIESGATLCDLAHDRNDRAEMPRA